MNDVRSPLFPLNATLVGCVTLGLVSGAGAAVGDFSNLEDARVSGKYDARLGEQLRGVRAEGVREGLSLSGVASVAYDDNIFQTATGAQEDLAIIVAPRVGYTVGQPDGRAFVEASYEGAAIAYLDHTEESRVDHRASVKASMRRKMLRMAYTGSWARLGNPDPDVGGSPERSEWKNRVAVGWEARGKTSAEISAEWSLLNQDSSSLNDIEEHAFGLSLLHQYSPKTEIGVRYEMGETDVDGAAPQDFQRITGQVRWAPRRKLSLIMEAGGEYREYEDGDSNWEPVFSGRLNWQPRQGTDLYLAGYRREEASSFFDGQNYTVTGAALGCSQRIHDTWTGGVEMGWEDADYFAVDGGASGRSDSSIFVRPTLSYLTESGHALELFYQWSDSDSSEPGFGYSNQEIGLSVEYQF